MKINKKLKMRSHLALRFILFILIVLASLSVVNAIKMKVQGSNLFVDSNGNVGIGTQSPAAKLNVAGGHIKMWGFKALQWGGNDDTQWDWAIRHTGTSEDLLFSRNSNAMVPLRLKGDSGFVGITEANPTERLHVNGNIRVSNLQGTGNDYVCVDANGVLFRSNTAC
jgi:hypothetical protein